MAINGSLMTFVLPSNTIQIEPSQVSLAAAETMGKRRSVLICFLIVVIVLTFFFCLFVFPSSSFDC